MRGLALAVGLLLAPAAWACQEHTSLLSICGVHVIAVEYPADGTTQFSTPRQFKYSEKVRRDAAAADERIPDEHQYVWDITGALKQVIYFDCPVSM